MKESLKKEVRERAKFCCEYCFAQMLFSADVFSIEHILPVVKGGLNILSNLALACQCCNNHKFTATQAIDIVTGSYFFSKTDPISVASFTGVVNEEAIRY